MSSDAVTPSPDTIELTAVGEPRGMLDAVERALLAQLHFSAGAWREGLDLVRTSSSEARGFALLEARALFALGEREAALALLGDWTSRAPDSGLGLYYQAQFLTQSGRGPEAAAVLRALVSRCPDFPGGLQSLATLMFPGPPYRDVLRRVHEVLRPRTYLEIGVEHGTSLALAVHSQQVVGIDPVQRPPTRELPRPTRLFHTSSDDFFAHHSREQVFGEAVVDLAFIDGMHWFEYALRDFCNVERWCGRSSTIILHDCLPVAGIAASRQRQTTFWVGDTWKALECLLHERRDLQVSIVPCHPSGLVVIQNLDPTSTALSSRLDALSAHYLPLAYPYEPGVLPGHYTLIPNTEAHVARLFGARGGSAPDRGEPV
jgi:hypothetical protein